MDIAKYLKNVKNLDDYNVITHEFAKNDWHSKIRLNMSMVLALKKVRALEIEHFNKNCENGVAMHIFQSLLTVSPSKTWGLLGKELISIFKYWLDTLRQYFVQHKKWWDFLSLLLKYLKAIRMKDVSINNTIIEELSESLLEILTHQQTSIDQQLQIIQCFNICSAESSREIRFALRNKFEQYFIKLSVLLSNCGDFRLQYSMLETLMRWLLPRQELSVRKQAAEVWFPPTLFSQNAVEIFLQRTWMNFFKDARDFLNAQNDKNKYITSVHCKRLVVGNLEFISRADKNYWLDLNIGNKNISLLLELKLLKILKANSNMSNALVITEDNVMSAKMLMEACLIKIELNIKDTKLMHTSDVLDSNIVKIYISPESVFKVNNSLEKIFEGKYQILLDLDKIGSSALDNTTESSQIDNSEDPARFSNPIQFRRRKHSGVVTRSGNPIPWQSPASTASTSSLALLREKLSALPGCQFDREPVSVCAVPQLSCVTEVSEIEQSQSLHDASTFQLRTFGVAQKSKTGSDRSTVTSRYTVSEKNNLSPSNIHDDNSISCLLVATIGSADESVINDTLDKLPKDKEINTDNIVDMLVKEALQSKKSDNKIKNNIKTSEVEGQENTLNLNRKGSEPGNPVETTDINTQVQESIDEINTDFIEDTPNYVISRPKKKTAQDNQTSTEIKKANKAPVVDSYSAFDPQIVEDFFSQHCREENGAMILSPTLAKKINETSSECSEDFDLPLNNDIPEFNFNEVDIVECLNDLVDKVCEELDNFINFQNTTMQNTVNDIIEAGLQNCEGNKSVNKGPKRQNKKSQKGNNSIKLEFKSKPRKQTKNKLQIEAVNKMSIIPESSENLGENIGNKDKSNSPNIPLIRRKRKLYSPNNPNLEAAELQTNPPETGKDDIAPPEVKQYYNTPKSKATPYKEIEQIKRSTRRIIRNKKMRSEPSLSPRSKRNDDVFNNLKKTVENTEKITLVDSKCNKNMAVYNFSSDSEDSDFKRKIIATAKKTAATKTRSRRNVPRINYSQKEPKAKKSTRKSKKIEQDILEMSEDNLIDERMREPAAVKLNTSIIIEASKEVRDNLEPNINVVPEMEAIEDQPVEKNTKKTRSKRKTKKTKKKDQFVKSGNELVLEVHQEKEPSVSPLPALIVESLPKRNDLEDSVTALEKLQDLCENESIGKHLGFNTSQNITSDVEQINYSPFNLKPTNDTNDIEISDKSSSKGRKKRNTISNAVDRTSDMNGKQQSINSNKAKKIKKTKKNSMSSSIKSRSSSRKSNGFKLLEVSAVIEHNSINTIQTLGKSPITGHGDSGEKPPNCKELDRNLKPRDLEIEYLDDSIKDYHKSLAKESNKFWNSGNSDGNSKISDDEVRRIIENSPSVSVKKLTPQEINGWIAPRYNSVFGSNQSDSSEKQTRSRRQEKEKSSSPVTVKKTNKIQSSISPIMMFKPKAIESKDVNMNEVKSVSSKSIEIRSQSKNQLRKRMNDAPVVETVKRRKPESVHTIASSKPGDVSMERVKKLDKKQKSGTITNVSVPSVSVTDWMRQSETAASSIPPESFETYMYRENINLILEKMNTTLGELQNETSRKFTELFVDMQRQLKESSEIRHQSLRTCACDLVHVIVQHIDYKFKEMDDNFRVMDEQIRNNFKVKTQQLVREDAKKKRQFIKLLKYDIKNSYREHSSR